MTNREVVGNLRKLNEMKDREKEGGFAKLTIKVGYAVRKNIDTLEKLYIPYLKSLEDIQARYPVEEIGTLKFKNKEEEKEYWKKVNELLDIDNPENKIYTVTFENIKNCKNLTMEDMDALFFLIEE